ncbi:primosomal replication protein PriB/PriC domain protein [Salmonella enterica subsp. enterica serovar Typhimurium]|nr:primosomal replication protein PriB/PriC domain protein [Salmonella enterica subsp. enterica serovar Typhimurium]
MTRAGLQELYNAYLEAELAVLKGKSIMLNSQSMTMESLEEIRKGRREIEDRLQRLNNPRRLFTRARLS